MAANRVSIVPPRRTAEGVWTVDDDAAVVGLVLIGSRGFEGMATDRSDHDVIAVVTDGHSWANSRSRSVDVIVVPLDDFPGYAMPGHAESWNRYTFVHARVLGDHLGGRITELVRAKARLSDEEGRHLARGALDAYVNSCYRSLKNVRDRRSTAAHLDAADSLPHLLTALFAAYGRVRPYNKYLAWELRADPLAGSSVHPGPAVAPARTNPARR